MLLVIDVGNTNTVIGVFKNRQLAGHWRLETKKERTADELGILVRELLNFAKHNPENIKSIAIANVVPTMTHALNDMGARYFGVTPFTVGSASKSPLTIKLDNPAELGADRLVNAVAAFTTHRTDSLIIDFGTATTFDVVTAKGKYLGGVICPGIGISAEALFHRASKLPRVEVAKPKRVIGKNTVECMQAGLYFGYVGMVDALTARITAEFGKPLKVIATGGLAQIIAGDARSIEIVDDLLTLTGLRILHELNAAA